MANAMRLRQSPPSSSSVDNRLHPHEQHFNFNNVDHDGEEGLATMPSSSSPKFILGAILASFVFASGMISQRGFVINNDEDDLGQQHFTNDTVSV